MHFVLWIDVYRLRFCDSDTWRAPNCHLVCMIVLVTRSLGRHVKSTCSSLSLSKLFVHCRYRPKLWVVMLSSLPPLLKPVHLNDYPHHQVNRYCPCPGSLSSLLRCLSEAYCNNFRHLCRQYGQSLTVLVEAVGLLLFSSSPYTQSFALDALRKPSPNSLLLFPFFRCLFSSLYVVYLRHVYFTRSLRK